MGESLKHQAKEVYRKNGIRGLISGIGRYLYWNLLIKLPYSKVVVKKIYSTLDNYVISSPEDIYSEKYYTKRLEEDRRSDAENFVECIYDFFQPLSLIHI